MKSHSSGQPARPTEGAAKEGESTRAAGEGDDLHEAVRGGALAGARLGEAGRIIRSRLFGSETSTPLTDLPKTPEARRAVPQPLLSPRSVNASSLSAQGLSMSGRTTGGLSGSATGPLSRQGVILRSGVAGVEAVWSEPVSALRSTPAPAPVSPSPLLSLSSPLSPLGTPVIVTEPTPTPGSTLSTPSSSDFLVSSDLEIPEQALAMNDGQSPARPTQNRSPLSVADDGATAHSEHAEQNLTEAPVFAEDPSLTHAAPVWAEPLPDPVQAALFAANSSATQTAVPQAASLLEAPATSGALASSAPPSSVLPGADLAGKRTEEAKDLGELVALLHSDTTHDAAPLDRSDLESLLRGLGASSREKEEAEIREMLEALPELHEEVRSQPSSPTAQVLESVLMNDERASLMSDAELLPEDAAEPLRSEPEDSMPSRPEGFEEVLSQPSTKIAALLDALAPEAPEESLSDGDIGTLDEDAVTQLLPPSVRLTESRLLIDVDEEPERSSEVLLEGSEEHTELGISPVEAAWSNRRLQQLRAGKASVLHTPVPAAAPRPAASAPGERAYQAPTADGYGDEVPRSAVPLSDGSLSEDALSDVALSDSPLSEVPMPSRSAAFATESTEVEALEAPGDELFEAFSTPIGAIAALSASSAAVHVRHAHREDLARDLDDGRGPVRVDPNPNVSAAPRLEPHADPAHPYLSPMDVASAQTRKGARAASLLANLPAVDPELDFDLDTVREKPAAPAPTPAPLDDLDLATPTEREVETGFGASIPDLPASALQPLDTGREGDEEGTVAALEAPVDPQDEPQSAEMGSPAQQGLENGAGRTPTVSRFAPPPVGELESAEPFGPPRSMHPSRGQTAPTLAAAPAQPVPAPHGRVAPLAEIEPPATPTPSPVAYEAEADEPTDRSGETLDMALVLNTLMSPIPGYEPAEAKVLLPGPDPSVEPQQAAHDAVVLSEEASDTLPGPSASSEEPVSQPPVEHLWSGSDDTRPEGAPSHDGQRAEAEAEMPSMPPQPPTPVLEDLAAQTAPVWSPGISPTPAESPVQTPVAASARAEKPSASAPVAQHSHRRSLEVTPAFDGALFVGTADGAVVEVGDDTSSDDDASTESISLLLTPDPPLEESSSETGTAEASGTAEEAASAETEAAPSPARTMGQLEPSSAAEATPPAAAGSAPGPVQEDARVASAEPDTGPVDSSEAPHPVPPDAAVPSGKETEPAAAHDAGVAHSHAEDSDSFAHSRKEAPAPAGRERRPPPRAVPAQKRMTLKDLFSSPDLGDSAGMGGTSLEAPPEGPSGLAPRGRSTAELMPHGIGAETAARAKAPTIPTEPELALPPVRDPLAARKAVAGERVENFLKEDVQTLLSFRILRFYVVNGIEKLTLDELQEELVEGREGVHRTLNHLVVVGLLVSEGGYYVLNTRARKLSLLGTAVSWWQTPRRREQLLGWLRKV